MQPAIQKTFLDYTKGTEHNWMYLTNALMIPYVCFLSLGQANWKWQILDVNPCVYLQIYLVPK